MSGTLDQGPGIYGKIFEPIPITGGNTGNCRNSINEFCSIKNVCIFEHAIFERHNDELTFLEMRLFHIFNTELIREPL